MKDEYLNAIEIGEGLWIKYVDLSSNEYRNAENLDLYLTVNEKFWSLLETNCVAGCCGIDAFDLYPDEITRVASQFPKSSIESELIEAKKNILNSKSTAFCSKRLNWTFEKSVLIELVDHIIKNVSKF